MRDHKKNVADAKHGCAYCFGCKGHLSSPAVAPKQAHPWYLLPLRFQVAQARLTNTGLETQDTLTRCGCRAHHAYTGACASQAAMSHPPGQVHVSRAAPLRAQQALLAMLRFRSHASRGPIESALAKANAPATRLTSRGACAFGRTCPPARRCPHGRSRRRLGSS